MDKNYDYYYQRLFLRKAYAYIFRSARRKIQEAILKMGGDTAFILMVAE
jgi:hypothetical protein